MTFAHVDANFGEVEAVKAAASRRTPKKGNSPAGRPPLQRRIRLGGTGGDEIRAIEERSFVASLLRMTAKGGGEDWNDRRQSRGMTARGEGSCD